nr:hypothetical protein [uncultured Microbacterium sp.]
MGSVGVGLHNANLAVGDPFSSVDVAERCHEDGAALLGFLTQLVGNISAVFRRAVLVEGRQDALHELTYRAPVDALCCRNESHAALLQLHHREGFVVPVPVEAGQLVDDDVVDVSIGADAFQHLLKARATGSLGAGQPGVDVLAHDLEPHLLDLFMARQTLCG